VPPATRPLELLPAAIEGVPVVGALFDNRAVSLDTPLYTDGRIAPLLLSHWEGRDVFRRSAALLLLEAARRLAPTAAVQTGQSLSTALIIYVPDQAARTALASLPAEMDALASHDEPFHEEIWSVEEAQAYFEQRGESAAARLLLVWRNPTVRLARFGETRVLHSGPLLPTARALRGARIVPTDDGFLLDLAGTLGSYLPSLDGQVVDPIELERVAPRYGAPMIREHAAWLGRFGVRSVGDANDLSVRRRAGELIRASEGFHEKSIGRIADRILASEGRVRVIAVSGPSSSGKTTFIKRLTVQLQINGIQPEGISLDDYYRDRAAVPIDASGQQDFEAFEALDTDELRDDVRGLLAGETVATSRYDFLTGLSNKNGRSIALPEGRVLLVEGIHGLNPRLFDGIVDPRAVFRIFIHPATTMPFDRLAYVSPSDLRLLRRIVRDRHHRGFEPGDTIRRWPSVRRGERLHIFPFLGQADAVFDSALAYELSVLKVFAEQYLLEVKQNDPSYVTAYRLRHLIDRIVALHPDRVPPTSILREFIGGSGFEY
jgi:uridine kinase